MKKSKLLSGIIATVVCFSAVAGGLQVGQPGSGITDPTLGGTTNYQGTSVAAANYHYGNAYMNARNVQTSAMATPVAPSGNSNTTSPVAPPTQTSKPMAIPTPQPYNVPPKPQAVPRPLAYHVPPTPATQTGTEKTPAMSVTEPPVVVKTAVSPFAPSRGGNNHASGYGHSEHGTGNGANNAAGSHSAHGLGGGEHVGGGRSGGGFHY